MISTIWEQRMATWIPQLLIETDIAYETFIPWNSRAVFTTMLQVSFEERKSWALFKKIIHDYCPAIDNWPINPKDWPHEKSILKC